MLNFAGPAVQPAKANIRILPSITTKFTQTATLRVTSSARGAWLPTGTSVCAELSGTGLRPERVTFGGAAPDLLQNGNPFL